MNTIHGFAAIVVATMMIQGTFAQDYKPGQSIEYKRFGEWEPGVILRQTSDGKQYIVRMKEAPGGTKGGEEKAFYPADLRPAQRGKPNPEPSVPMVKPMPMPNPGQIQNPRAVDPKKPIVINPGPGNGATGQGLMTKEDILAYLRLHLPMPYGANHDKVLVALREEIKKRGTNFIMDKDYYNELWKRGANVSTIFQTIDGNYGKVPKLEDYYGSYLLRGAKRGVKTFSKDGTKLIQTTADAQSETGAITINKDGTYVWKLVRNDSEDKWIKGKWRVAKDSERVLTEGGPVLILENAAGVQDYHVRKSRVPDYEGWIDLGMDSGRSGIHYGRPVQ